MVEMKKCSGCGEEKELNKENFLWRDDIKKFQNICIECLKIKNNKNIIVKNGIKYIKCSGECGLEKELNEHNFYWRKDKVTFRKECNICIKNKRKIYYSNNKTKINKQHKIYNENNKEKTNIQKNEYSKNKRKNNPEHRLKHTISAQIRDVLKNKKGGKSILKYLPYTMEELKKHIELLFEPWMTWKNWGKYNKKTHKKNPTWNLDHIIPHSSFKYDNMDCQEFRDCWALTNLQPLDSKENILKGNKV